jgi:hypothetical protein
MQFETFSQNTNKGINTLAATQQEEPLINALINFIIDSSIDRIELFQFCENLLSHSTDASCIFPSEQDFTLFISTLLQDPSDLSTKLSLLKSCIKRSSTRVIQPILAFIIENDSSEFAEILGLCVDRHPIEVLDYLCAELGDSIVPERILQTINMIENIASYSFPSCFFLSHIKSLLLAGNKALLVQVEKLIISIYGGDRV